MLPPIFVNFYPRSPCGERQRAHRFSDAPPEISIHALLAESDTNTQQERQEQRISIHALLAESDVVDTIKFAGSMLFLSTLSLRRATPKVFRHCTTYLFLSTLSLRRATLSTHIIGFLERVFLSTLSLRRATAFPGFLVCGSNNFYPRSPCGERRSWTHWPITRRLFLSTLSLRRATWKRFPLMCIIRHFYPRSPCGERRVHFDNFNLHCVISIHALLAESDSLRSAY